MQTTVPTFPHNPTQGNAGGTPAPVFETIESAAVKLAVPPAALRSRCRRAAKQSGNSTTVHLGGGIVAFKFGRSWRIQFPPRASSYSQSVGVPQ